MPRIFICYRREDEPAAARRLHDLLADRFGAGDVFMDVRKVLYGANFVRVVVEAIESAEVLIAVIGNKWLRPPQVGATDHVLFEIETAIERGVPVVPVLVGTARMPAAHDLPDAVRELSFLNALPLDPADWGPATQSLFAEIESIRATEDLSGHVLPPELRGLPQDLVIEIRSRVPYVREGAVRRMASAVGWGSSGERLDADLVEAALRMMSRDPNAGVADAAQRALDGPPWNPEMQISPIGI